MSNRIKQLREEMHMTQVRLSIELEISQETISAYESGKHYPSVSTLLKLSKILNSSCDYILGISDIRFPEHNVIVEKDSLVLSRWSRLNSSQQDLTLAYMDGLLDMKKE